ncbi:MAG: ABC transporter permease [Sphingobacteriales bacterium]|jgi:lipopolysaccharide transport system permease protein|nr:ABC transporter permease [Sphingobacteriales bacterium]
MNEHNWTEIIKPYNKLLDLKLKEVWRYRDLLRLLVHRDFVSNYKQTILGPLWFFIQPILTTIMFVIVFGSIAKIGTDGIPMIVFYLAGITLWNYFSDCLNKTATVFKDNAALFGKVYFPRLIMPLSIIVSNLVRLSIQFALFLIIWIYYVTVTQTIQPNFYIVFFPFLILLMGGMALGLGLIISALTSKYKDLIFLLSFSIQLWMYATPVIYPLSSIPEKYKWLINLNPMSSIIEIFRYGFLGKGEFSWASISYSILFTIIILILGSIIFNKVEKTFMDTV